MVASGKTNGRRDRLVEALRQLAAEARVQVDYLERLRLGDSADEMALEFHDSVVLLGQLVDDGAIDEETAEAVLAVDQKLNEMSGERHRQLWTRAALQQSDAWKEVRRLAVIALASLEDVGQRRE